MFFLSFVVVRQRRRCRSRRQESFDPLAGSCVSLDESFEESFNDPSVRDESVEPLLVSRSVEESLADDPSVLEEPTVPDWSVGAEESVDMLLVPRSSLDESFDMSVVDEL